MNIIAAEMIRYAPPQYLIEKLGVVCDEETLQELNSREVEIEGETWGWYPYTNIIYDREEQQYYLAEVL
jgi:hypothetical protein